MKKIKRKPFQVTHRFPTTLKTWKHRTLLQKLLFWRKYYVVDIEVANEILQTKLNAEGRVNLDNMLNQLKERKKGRRMTSPNPLTPQTLAKLLLLTEEEAKKALNPDGPALIKLGELEYYRDFFIVGSSHKRCRTLPMNMDIQEATRHVSDKIKTLLNDHDCSFVLAEGSITPMVTLNNTLVEVVKDA